MHYKKIINRSQGHDFHQLFKNTDEKMANNLGE